VQIERLDLHGLFVAEAMTRFVRKYNWLVGQQSGETHMLDVIHGKGRGEEAGAIREALRTFLKAQGKRINGYDAQLALRGAEYLFDNSGRLAYMHGEDVDRNSGHTYVVPRERVRLPTSY
jgi:hypothetical protein